MEKKLFGIIYKITNQINGKVYIGQTINELSARLRRHRSDAKLGKSNNYVHKAIRKYSWENFIFEVIACAVDRDSLNLLEILLIIQYNSKDQKVGYNNADGGNVNSGYTRAKTSNQKQSDTKSNPVAQFSLKGNFITEYKSIKAASIATNLKCVDILRAANGKYKQSGGFLWCYNGKKDKLIVPTNIKIKNHAVEQISMITGEVLATYHSVKTASIVTNVNRGNIGSCCKGKQKTSGGFLWRYSHIQNPTRSQT